MKIRFGLDRRKSLALPAGMIAMTIVYICTFYQQDLRLTHDIIVKSRLLNVTPSIVKMPCGLRYDDYRCSALPTTSNISNICLNGAQITSIRLFPLLSFVLQLYVIYELFSLIEERIRFLIHILGIGSILTYTVVTILIYHDTCAQFFISVFLFTTSFILFMLAFWDMQRDETEPRRPSRNIQNQSQSFFSIL